MRLHVPLRGVLDVTSGPLRCVQMSRSGPRRDVLDVTVWSAKMRFGCHGLAREEAFWMSRSGPQRGVLDVTSGRLRGVQMSRSGPRRGVLDVTVWSAECYGLVRCSGVPVWSAKKPFGCHGLVH